MCFRQPSSSGSVNRSFSTILKPSPLESEEDSDSPLALRTSSSLLSTGKPSPAESLPCSSKNELESLFLPEISFNRVAFESSLDPPLVSISSSSDFADFFRRTSSLLFSMLSLAQDIFELILLYVCFQFETV
ncbi:hypothetical protein O6H91_20G011300 [Diphasiastrum complanatum]|uniref:Uncharacterized protein n=1 Tax=Diphasiastrum complanatum TaxID=34168 RepID=A0ACC2AMQ6_DIPCM|nr:hypothetical protein O6H91_20G011300 [Diphasiastrum complanatum]